MFSWMKKKDSKRDKEVKLVLDDASSRGRQPFVFRVSRSLLVEHSPVFRKMAEDGTLKKVKLKGVTSVGLRKLLEYLTTGSVPFLTHPEAVETLRASHVYEVTSLNDFCSEFLITVLDPDNVCETYEASRTSFHHQLEYQCLKFIDQRAEDVLESSGFRTLQRASAENIVRRQSLDVRSEMPIFRAILAWGQEDCARRGVDSENVLEIRKSVGSLLRNVRFATMSERDLSDPDISRFFKLLSEESGGKSKRTSILRSESTSSSETSLSCRSGLCQDNRRYVPGYACDLLQEMQRKCDSHPVRSGETFRLRVELLKGRVFLTGLTLGFDHFIDSKGDACLYAALTATNVQSGERAAARGAFMVSEEGEPTMKFSDPLVAGKSDTVEVVLNIRRAVNVCPVLVGNDSRIDVCEEIAMKITPLNATSGTGAARTMFKSIRYFY